MLDLKFLRDNLDQVESRLASRGDAVALQMLGHPLAKTPQAPLELSQVTDVLAEGPLLADRLGLPLGDDPAGPARARIEALTDGRAGPHGGAIREAFGGRGDVCLAGINPPQVIADLEEEAAQ